LAIPYQAAGFEALAKELIAITRAEPTTEDPDREIINGWAELDDKPRAYSAGSWGPAASSALMAREELSWFEEA
ncbi:MAG: hypothetical protein ACOVKR_00550, partial [Limnohabitans sp.]